MNKKNTLIFDLDGTLLDTLDDLTSSVQYALSEMGLPTRSREEVRSFVGNGIAVLISKSVPEGTDEATINKALEIFKKHYAHHCNDITGPYPGIIEMIDQLQKRKIKMAIVSNKADFATKELAEIYFHGKIPVAIGEKESEGIKKKPAPDTVFKALEILESTIEEAVYVGDSEVDIATANNAGMDLILCSWGFRDVQYLKEQGGEIIVDQPDDILSLVL